MDEEKVATTIIITKGQREWLREVAYKNKTSKSQIIRDLIDDQLGLYKKGE